MANTGSKNGPPIEGGKGKGGKAKQKQQLLIFGGAAAAVAVFALMKKQSAAASAGTATTGQLPVYNSTGSDQFNQLSDQIAALQGQLSNITQGAGSTAPPSTTPKPPVPTSGGSSSPLPKPIKIGKPLGGPTSGQSKPRSIFRTVTVQHNQTLSGIAKSDHESLAQLLKDNPTYTTNRKYQGGRMIWAGDKVKLR